VNSDGTILYTPAPGHTGIDSFQYQICDPEGRDTAWVFITLDDCIIPNAFSPNGDGINDFFVIPCGEGDIVFSVWNRWGIEVYRSEFYQNDWDGGYKGGKVPDGTYYYVLKYTKRTGEQVNKAGFITLRR
jgi:gliding motility-associated-like protein